MYLYSCAEFHITSKDITYQVCYSLVNMYQKYLKNNRLIPLKFEFKTSNQIPTYILKDTDPLNANYDESISNYANHEIIRIKNNQSEYFIVFNPNQHLISCQYPIYQSPYTMPLNSEQLKEQLNRDLSLYGYQVIKITPVHKNMTGGHMVFHGTSNKNAQNIIKNGFQTSQCGRVLKNCGAYGSGCYVTNDPTSATLYSHENQISNSVCLLICNLSINQINWQYSTTYQPQITTGNCNYGPSTGTRHYGMGSYEYAVKDTSKLRVLYYVQLSVICK